MGWAAFIGIWYLVSAFLLDTRRLPAPHTAAVDSWDVLTGGEFGANFGASITKLAAGFVLALAIGIALAALAAYNEWWRNLIRGLLGWVASAPTVALAVYALIIFGIASAGPIMATMAATVPYVTNSLIQGLFGVDRRLIVMSESFGRTRSQIISAVLVPASLLSLGAGLRIAFAVAWRVELLTEVFAAPDGFGAQIRRRFESYDIRGMIGWTVVFVVIMILVESLIFRQLERRLSVWRSPSTSAVR